MIKSLNLQKKLREVPNKNETIEDYIGYCEYLLDDMQLLEMNILVLLF